MLVACWYTELYDGSTPSTFLPPSRYVVRTTSRISPEPAPRRMLSGFTPWCFAISPTRLPSGYPYRFEYFQALFIAFITDSGGPQQFSLLDRCANESYSFETAPGRAAPPPCVRPCAKRSISVPTPR